MTQAPTLMFSPGWDAVERYEDAAVEAQLGDGYTSVSPVSLQQDVVWDVTHPGMRTEAMEELVEQLKLWGGVQAFIWSPSPGNVPNKLYFCERWQVSPLGQDVWSFSGQFVEDVRGACAAFAALIPEADILNKLIGASAFLTSFTSGSGNYLVNSDSNLVLRTLHTHSEQVPSTHGRLYDQLSLALGCIVAYEATEDEIWLTRATNYGQAIVDNYYIESPVSVETTALLTESGDSFITESGDLLLLESE